MEHRAINEYLRRLDSLLGDVLGPTTARLIPVRVPAAPTRRRTPLYPYGVFDRRAGLARGRR
ncbi:MAG: hypothetical protein ACRD0N_04700 [Acidimicrobiales bacterium]